MSARRDDAQKSLLNRQALLEELNRLREALRAKESASAYDGRSGLIVARLCAGLSQAEWDELVREGGFHHWLTLPADENPMPHLAQLQKTLDELSYQSYQDPLTGLANRRTFQKALKIELERAFRGSTPLCLAMLDLDDFKSVNDRFGHVCGDKVLISLAGAMLQGTRTYDTAARVGGEEFALILPGSSMHQAEATVARLLGVVRGRKVVCEGVESPVGMTVSVGLACTKGKAPLSVDAFMDLADKALYQAKSQGKDRLVKAPIPDLVDTSKDTLVHAQEKQFLFTGPDS